MEESHPCSLTLVLSHSTIQITPNVTQWHQGLLEGRTYSIWGITLYLQLRRAPWELPVSSQRASGELSVHERTIPVWNNLWKHLFVIFFFVFITFIGRFLCLTRSLFCHVFLYFCKCWKVFSHSVLTSSTRHAATSFALLSNLMSFWFAFFFSCLCYCLHFAHHEITNMQKQFLFLSWFTMESLSWLIIRKTLSCKIIYHWIPNWNTPLIKLFFSIYFKLELFVVYGVLSLQCCDPSWPNYIFNIWIFCHQWCIN